MSKRKLAASLLLVTGLLALTAAAGSARPLGASHVSGLPNTCGKPVGTGQYVIASDLPLQGALRPLTIQIVRTPVSPSGMRRR